MLSYWKWSTSRVAIKSNFNFTLFGEKDEASCNWQKRVTKIFRVVKNSAIVTVLIILWNIISQNQSCVWKCNVEV